MQPVRKKKRKFNIKVLTVVLTVLFLSVTTVYFLQRKPFPKPSPLEDLSVILINQDEDTLTRMEITNMKGEGFTLLREKEQFVVEGRPSFEADQIEVSLMVKDLTMLVANELAGEVHADEHSLKMLGLGKEAPRVKAEYKDGSSLTLVFGNSAQTEVPSDYLMFENDNKIYFVSPETREHFDRSLASLHVVPAINFNEKLVDSVAVEGEENFVLSHQEGLWELESPYRYPLDSVKVSQLLNAIGKMRFAQYYGSEEELNKKELGLIPPRRVMRFHLSKSTITGYDKDGVMVDSESIPEQTVSLAIGDNIGQIGLYCLYEGKVYQATNVSMGFLRDLSVKDLLSPSPVTLPLNRVNRLDVEKPGMRHEYKINFIEKILPNNEFERDQDGNILYEPLITLSGEEMPSDEFVREYLKLMDLKHSGRLPEGFAPTSDEPLIHYTFHTSDGKREVAFFPFDDLHYAIRVNGVFIDYIVKAEVDAVSL